MKILVYISRIFVGALFIVSGLIKANDTLGFSYKLEEYFENGALAFRIRNWFGWDSFSLEFLTEYALALAIIMCAAEIILGFSILFGTKIKFTVYSLLGLTTLFFFLTLHTWQCDPLGTYNEVTTIEHLSPAHDALLVKMETNSKITIVEENTLEKTLTYQEAMPVQCVTDCGCFGDAMKGSLGRPMKPFESWLKDVILMLFLIPIYLFRNKIKINVLREDLIIGTSAFVFVGFLSWVFNWYFPMVFFAMGYLGYYATKRMLFNTYLRWLPILVVTVITAIIIIDTLSHLPIKDYRAYAVGKSIPEQMVLPEGAVESVYENLFYYKNKTTGVVEEFSETNYPWDDDNYEFSDRKTKLISQGDVAAITDFTMVADDGNDYASDFFNEEGYIFMFVAYDIKKTKEKNMPKMNTFVENCNANGNYVVGLTASLYNEVEEFRHENQTMFEFYNCDAITLKTIVRANPGIVLMKKGQILAKWNLSDLPDYKEVEQEYLNKQ